MTKSALPLPTPIAMPSPVHGPAPLPYLHNASPVELATGIALDMHRRHAVGDHNPAADDQDEDTMIGLVGILDAARSRFILPAYIRQIIVTGTR